MPDAGYVYVMINPTLEGLVKIGKTTRNPHERAAELSAATGVAAPFIVVFDVFFEDCAGAESFVHTRLTQQNYRYSSNREFFTAPVNDAIKAVLEAQNLFSTGKNLPDDEDGDFFDDSNLGNPWDDVFELAEASCYGLDDTLQDYDEALNLYKQAAKLGSDLAYLQIGIIYRDEFNNAQQALTYLKEGAKRGIVECYAEMPQIFFANGQIENAVKCWNRFFDAIDSLLSHHTLGRYCCNYVLQMKMNRLPLTYQRSLVPVRDAIRDAAEDLLETAKAISDYDIIPHLEADLLFIRYIFYPEIPRNVIQGSIKWWKPEKGFGFISQRLGEDIFLHESNFMEEYRTIREGQRVEFEVVQSEQGPRACNVRLL